MKITIDTKEDSHDDLRKVIKMLQHLVGEDAVTNAPNIFEDTSTTAPATDAFANMFGSVQDDAPQANSSAAIEKKEEPKIIFYD